MEHIGTIQTNHLLKKECSICGSEDTDDEFFKGYFGILPVSFCEWCMSSLMDMANQLNPCECRDDE
jgi:hypothetical protein